MTCDFHNEKKTITKKLYSYDPYQYKSVLKLRFKFIIFTHVFAHVRSLVFPYFTSSRILTPRFDEARNQRIFQDDELSLVKTGLLDPEKSLRQTQTQAHTNTHTHGVISLQKAFLISMKKSLRYTCRSSKSTILSKVIVNFAAVHYFKIFNFVKYNQIL